ncbi:hypothetical protein GCM10011504_02840 [Siccirubricoccus deserti]|nr:hypothetical protein GCM10011504_02840 [Siccirubricoccus deserti]
MTEERFGVKFRTKELAAFDTVGGLARLAGEKRPLRADPQAAPGTAVAAARRMKPPPSTRSPS